MNELWSGTAGVLVGVVVAGAIPLWREWWRRRIERRGELTATWAELYLAKRAFDALANDGVQAPLYRLSIALFERSLPKLIGEGSLRSGEIGVLVEYINRATEVNRGLDRAGAAHAAGQLELVAQEYARNLAKVRELEAPEVRFKSRSLFDATKDAVMRLEDAFKPLVKMGRTQLHYAALIIEVFASSLIWLETLRLSETLRLVDASFAGEPAKFHVWYYHSGTLGFALLLAAIVLQAGVGLSGRGSADITD
jgi:hypothetical protein